MAPHRNFGIAITIDAGPYVGGETRDTNAGGVLSEPVGERRPGLIYGVGNLIENAVEFARLNVVVTARWNDREVTIVIVDDGPGIAPDILETLGEPYVTTRARTGAKADETKATGLGLGFFIAKTLLERSGAVVSMTNVAPPRTGATATLTWSRHTFEGTEPAWSAFPGRQKKPSNAASPTP